MGEEAEEKGIQSVHAASETVLEITRSNTAKLARMETAPLFSQNGIISLEGRRLLLLPLNRMSATRSVSADGVDVFAFSCYVKSVYELDKRHWRRVDVARYNWTPELTASERTRERKLIIDVYTLELLTLSASPVWLFEWSRDTACIGRIMCTHTFKSEAHEVMGKRLVRGTTASCHCAKLEQFEIWRRVKEKLEAHKNQDVQLAELVEEKLST